MNHTSGWVFLVTSLSWAAGAGASLGCDRHGNDEIAVGAPSLTSADWPKTVTDNSDSLACEGPSDNQTSAVCGSAEATAPNGVITLPAVLLKGKSRAAKGGKAPSTAATVDTSTLDEAIAEEAARAPDENATQAPPAVAQVTTTSATVPVAPVSTTHISFVTHLPSTYALQRLRMNVDGKTEYDASTPGSVSVPAGHHVVQVIANYKLRDPVFTYVDDYGVVLESTQEVPATSGPIDLVATAVRSGGVTTPMDRQAAVEWRTTASR